MVLYAWNLITSEKFLQGPSRKSIIAKIESSSGIVSVTYRGKYSLYLVERKTSPTNHGRAFNVYKCFTFVASLIVEWWITIDLCSYAKKD